MCGAERRSVVNYADKIAHHVDVSEIFYIVHFMHYDILKLW
jgi:hypothetical protein